MAERDRGRPIISHGTRELVEKVRSLAASIFVYKGYSNFARRAIGDAICRPRDEAIAQLVVLVLGLQAAPLAASSMPTSVAPVHAKRNESQNGCCATVVRKSAIGGNSDLLDEEHAKIQEANVETLQQSLTAGQRDQSVKQVDSIIEKLEKSRSWRKEDKSGRNGEVTALPWPCSTKTDQLIELITAARLESLLPCDIVVVRCGIIHLWSDKVSCFELVFRCWIDAAMRTAAVIALRACARCSMAARGIRASLPTSPTSVTTVWRGRVRKHWW